jgi:bacillithiol biosynthesis deacetylase BshB1
MSEPIDVLALAAHPDDAEAGCGATLALAAVGGLRTAIADLTAGEAATHGTPAQRASERDRASEVLRLSTRVTLGLPDTAVGTDPSHRTEVATLLRALRPRIVLAPYPRDRHPDHAAAGRLARDACFLAGVTGPTHPATSPPPHRPERLYHYMLHEPFVPSFIIDVSATWERSRAAVTAYASQFDRPPDDRRTPIAGGAFLDYLAARAVMFGALVGVAHGEAFHTTGPVALTTLPGLERPRPSAPRYRAIL